MKIILNAGKTERFYNPVKNAQNSKKQYIGNNLNFKGNLPKTKTFIDKVLGNKFCKKLFKLADINPFAFNVAALLTACVILRPVTILALPGTNKEDKQYAAGKSIISATLANASRLAFILPLGILMKKMGEKAKTDSSFKFPKIKTRRFNAFNYLVNNSSAFILSLPMSGLMVVAVAKIMNKIMPSENIVADNKNNNVGGK